MAKILVVEDDDVCAGLIGDLLQGEGHVVDVVEDGSEGLDRVRLYQYDLAVLDWELPHRSGIEICQQARNSGKQMPILMLTGRGAIAEKEHGFDAGADDYLTKPFDGRELLARVRALLRRTPVVLSERLVVGELCLDLRARQISRGSDRPMDLLPREFSLLEYFLKHPNQTFSLDHLLNAVWSSESEASPEAIRKCVERIRKKIDLPDKPSAIETVHRVGYVFRA